MIRPLLLVAVALGALTPDPPRPPVGLFGFAVGVHPEEARRQRFRYPPRLEPLESLGASAILLAPQLPIANRRASVVGAGDPSEHLQIARRARRRGLAVVWMPRLALAEAGADDWRGNLSPQDRGRFWRSYRDAIVSHARWAAEEGVALFAIGSELSSLSGPETASRWAAIAEAVRGEVDAPLAFVANHDALDQRGPFGAVDVVGVSAYFPVGRDPRRAWRDAAERMAALAEETGKPLVVFELGCPSRVGALQSPWDDTVATPVDLEGQRRYFAAARRALVGQRWLHGLFVWEAFGPGGPHDRSYTPFGKPAAREVARLLWGRHSGGSLSQHPIR